MFDGATVVAALRAAGITHVVWIPDSTLGTWNDALAAADGMALIRVCREGEAFAVAAGLHLGGKTPIVLLQCTGLFEAGDALRNVLFDMKIPLFFVLGVRSWLAHLQGRSGDTCPVYTEPILRAWGLTYQWGSESSTGADLTEAILRARREQRPGAWLIPE